MSQNRFLWRHLPCHQNTKTIPFHFWLSLCALFSLLFASLLPLFSAPPESREISATSSRNRLISLLKLSRLEISLYSRSLRLISYDLRVFSSLRDALQGQNLLLLWWYIHLSPFSFSSLRKKLQKLLELMSLFLFKCSLVILEQFHPLEPHYLDVFIAQLMHRKVESFTSKV